MANAPTAKETPAEKAEPRAPKDPLQSAQDIAERLVDDAEKLLTTATDGAARAAKEGIAVSADVVRAGLDSIAIIRNKIALAERSLREAHAASPKP